MTCAPFDLKDYLLGELNAAEKESVERHLLACAACHEEVVALNTTQAALLCIGDEEPLRRIAFVSDKVFEPRWWQKLFASAPQAGFASAAVLALAIVFHAVHTPAAAPVPAPVAQVQQLDQKAIDAEIEKRVAIAVEKASVEIEARQTDRLLQVVNTRLAQSDRESKTQLSYLAQYLERMYKQNGKVRRASFDSDGVSMQ
jgi:anti-sigma factor RsiW